MSRFSLGPCVRRVPNHEGALFLTFDDGPEPDQTERVLEVLQTRGVHATFFVVATKAAAHRNLIREIQKAGHGVGNHSLDHRYGPFFSSRETMKKWIERSHKIMEDLLGAPPIGFRSPAGIQTPPLHEALRELGIPLIHWNRRFFDRTLGWSERRALRSLERLQVGDIVLLHDVQRTSSFPTFLKTLDLFLSKSAEREIVWRALPNPKSLMVG